MIASVVTFSRCYVLSDCFIMEEITFISSLGGGSRAGIGNQGLFA